MAKKRMRNALALECDLEVRRTPSRHRKRVYRTADAMVCPTNPYLAHPHEHIASTVNRVRAVAWFKAEARSLGFHPVFGRWTANGRF